MGILIQIFVAIIIVVLLNIIKPGQRLRQKEDAKAAKELQEAREEDLEELKQVLTELDGRVEVNDVGGITIRVPEVVEIHRLFELLANRLFPWACHVDDELGNTFASFMFYESSGRDNDWYCCRFMTTNRQNNLTAKIIKDENEDGCWRKAEKYLSCLLNNRQIKRTEDLVKTLLPEGIRNAVTLQSPSDTIEERSREILFQSDYQNLFEKSIETHFSNSVLVVDYELPSRDTFLPVQQYKMSLTTYEVEKKSYSPREFSTLYENTLYSICLRSIYELFETDKNDEIEYIAFNGFVTAINKASGKTERKCILSLQAHKDQFKQIDLENVDPKLCFKSLKGVSGAKLIDVSPVAPVLTFNKEDHRFIKGHNVDVHSGTNLASMDWKDFEQLVRQVLEMEFGKNGGEVKVTQASRDGGVDAVIFDPDPLRGGKIIVQAKRYTNTVPVSAVRDLYGTLINEGASSGILITTSDYGPDSYDFAKDKPLKLLNSGHLLALLQKNGMQGYIDLEEARYLLKE